MENTVLKPHVPLSPCEQRQLIKEVMKDYNTSKELPTSQLIAHHNINVQGNGKKRVTQLLIHTYRKTPEHFE